MGQFKLQIGRRQFSPGIKSTLITVLLVGIFVHLSLWQYDRAQFKDNQKYMFEERMRMPIMRLENVDADAVFRQCEVKGKFLDLNILLDNQLQKMNTSTNQHKVIGYHLYSPFKLDGTNSIVLVMRGFIPLGESREILPIELSKNNLKAKNEITLQGILVKPKKGFVLAEKSQTISMTKSQITDNRNILRVQKIDLQSLSESLTTLDTSTPTQCPTQNPLHLAPLLLHLDPESPYSFEPTPVMIGSDASKHIGYSIQWLAFAVLTLIYYGVINTRGLGTKT